MTTRVVEPSAVVLHELRGPLGLMVTAARIAAEECTAESPIWQRVQTIERTALRLLASAEEVLSIALANSAGDGEPFDAAGVLVDAISDIAALGRPVDLSVSGRPTWQARQGNASQLVALVHSLLSNAADHGVPGEPVAVRVDCSAEGLELTVSNEVGSGQHRGLGIGNPVCQELAARLGGTLTRTYVGTRHEARFVLPAPDRLDGARGQPGRPVELAGSSGR